MAPLAVAGGDAVPRLLRRPGPGRLHRAVGSGRQRPLGHGSAAGVVGGAPRPARRLARLLPAGHRRPHGPGHSARGHAALAGGGRLRAAGGRGDGADRPARGPGAGRALRPGRPATAAPAADTDRRAAPPPRHDAPSHPVGRLVDAGPAGGALGDVRGGRHHRRTAARGTVRRLRVLARTAGQGSRVGRLAGGARRSRRLDARGARRPGPHPAAARPDPQRRVQGTRRLPGRVGALPRAHPEHGGPGCLGAGPGPPRGAHRRRVRLDRRRTAPRAAGRRVDGRPLHQHAAGPGGPRRRAAGRGSARPTPGAPEPPDTASARRARRGPEARGRRGRLRHTRAVRELPPAAAGPRPRPRRRDPQPGGRLARRLALPAHARRRARRRPDALQAGLPARPVRPRRRRDDRPALRPGPGADRR